jgi:hypothetical protein
LDEDDEEPSLDNLDVLILDRGLDLRSVTAEEFMGLLKEHGTSDMGNSMPAKFTIGTMLSQQQVGKFRLLNIPRFRGCGDASGLLEEIDDHMIPIVSPESCDINALGWDILHLNTDQKQWRLHTLMVREGGGLENLEENALNACQDRFYTLLTPDQTVENSILTIMEVCGTYVENNTFYSKKWYAGYMTPIFPRTIVDIWRVQKGGLYCHKLRYSIGRPEFATNLVKTRQGLCLVSNKYIGVEVNYTEEVRLRDGFCGLCKSDPSPCEDMVDFVWNVLFLELVTPERLAEFVKGEHLENTDVYLLNRDDVECLIVNGYHANYSQYMFHSETCEDITELANKINTPSISQSL